MRTINVIILMLLSCAQLRSMEQKVAHTRIHNSESQSRRAAIAAAVGQLPIPIVRLITSYEHDMLDFNRTVHRLLFFDKDAFSKHTYAPVLPDGFTLSMGSLVSSDTHLYLFLEGKVAGQRAMEVIQLFAYTALPTDKTLTALTSERISIDHGRECYYIDDTRIVTGRGIYDRSSGKNLLQRVSGKTYWTRSTHDGLLSPKKSIFYEYYDHDVKKRKDCHHIMNYDIATGVCRWQEDFFSKEDIPVEQGNSMPHDDLSLACWNDTIVMFSPHSCMLRVVQDLHKPTHWVTTKIHIPVTVERMYMESADEIIFYCANGAYYTVTLDDVKKHAGKELQGTLLAEKTMEKVDREMIYRWRSESIAHVPRLFIIAASRVEDFSKRDDHSFDLWIYKDPVNYDDQIEQLKRTYPDFMGAVHAIALRYNSRYDNLELTAGEKEIFHKYDGHATVGPLLKRCISNCSIRKPIYWDDEAQIFRDDDWIESNTKRIAQQKEQAAQAKAAYEKTLWYKFTQWYKSITKTDVATFCIGTTLGCLWFWHFIRKHKIQFRRW